METDRVFVAPVLRWNISPHTQFNFHLEYLHSNAPNDQGLPVLPGENRPAPVPRERNLGEPGAVTTIDDVRIGFNWSHELNEHWTLHQRFDAEFNEAALPSSVSFDGGFDPMNNSLLTRIGGEQESSKQTYTGSLDLTGKFDTFGLHHTLLLGGDFLQEDGSSLGRFTFTGVPSIDLFNPVHTGVPPGLLDNPESGFSFDDVEDWYGFYLQDQVELPYDLHLLAGFRYDNAGSGSTFGSIIPGPPSFSETSLRDDAVTPRFGLLWRPLPELSLFGSYVENFGVSSGRTVDDLPLPPQTAQQWEAGVKTELLDGRLTGSLAWFDLTKQNIAKPVPDPVLAAQGFQVPVGEVRHQGLELDVSGELSPGLQAIASFAYIDSEITIDRGLDFDNLDANGNPTITDGNTGHRLGNVPRFGGSLWTTYEFQGGDLQGLKLGAAWCPQREGNEENDFQLPGYATVNLLAGYQWKVGPSKVSLQLNVDNLLDKSFFESAFSRIIVSPGAPRTFLAQVHQKGRHFPVKT